MSTEPMSLEANKELARRFVEILNTGNVAKADAFYAPNFTHHLAVPGLPPGLAGFKALVTSVCAAFPDVHVTIDDMMADGDKVIVRDTARATHTGAFLGIPPTGQQVVWTEIHIHRVADGKIAEHWAELNMLGLLQQLGAVPAPG